MNLSVESVDELVQTVVPDVPAPPGRPTELVLVTGPWLAGATSVVAALRARMPEVEFVEQQELQVGDVPAVVVFVVSAAAPLAASDGALLDRAAAGTDAVIGVVTKIDAHRRWRDVLAADRALMGSHGVRYRRMPWHGVSAAPQLGEPQLDDLVAELRSQLSDPALHRRNRLQHWNSHLENTRIRLDEAADEDDLSAQRLRQQRSDLLRESRIDRSEGAIALRAKIAQARVQLSYFARRRCDSVRSELQEDAAAMTRRRSAAFPTYVAERVQEVVGEVNDGVTDHLVDVAQELGLDSAAPASVPPPHEPAVGRPLLRSRRLETRLVMLLGAGFGLGVALTLMRLFADLAPGLAVAGAVVCGLVGVAVTVWVVGTRGLLQDRAVLDRWVSDVMAETRVVVDQLVASRVLAAEAELSSAVVKQEEERRADVMEQIALIDNRLRTQALARAQAAAARDSAAPALATAQRTVSAELLVVQPHAKNVMNSENCSQGLN